MTQGGPRYDHQRRGHCPTYQKLKIDFPDITHPWYADNASALVMFVIVNACVNLLKRHGLEGGYYPKPPKSVLIVPPKYIEAKKRFFLHHGFKVCRGARYLVRNSRYDKSKRDWLKDRTKTWEWEIWHDQGNCWEITPRKVTLQL